MENSVKLTGHEDIDELFKETHALRKKGEVLKKEVERCLSYEPKPLKRGKIVTGHEDVDELLMKYHALLEEGKKLKIEIEKATAYAEEFILEYHHPM